MANVWFLGDLHLGHKNICKFRTGFDSEEHHYQTMKENYHKVVTKRDKVFFMGDFAFNKESLEDLKTWTAESKVLILGNHCLSNGINYKDFIGVYDEVHALLKYKRFWLSHCPIHPDELWGKINIHAHTHSKNIDDPRYFSTSMENIGYSPIDLETIRDRIALNNKPTRDI